MARTKNWDPQTKHRQIIDAAIEVLKQQHYLSCPVDDIARRAGVAKGTVYLYFKSKEALYCSVLCELLDRLRRMTEDADRDGRPAKQNLRDLLRSMGEFFEAHQHVFASFQREPASMDAPLRRRLQEKYQRLFSSLSGFIDKGIRQREFKAYPAPLIGELLLAFTSIPARQRGKNTREVAGGTGSFELVFDVLMEGIAR